MKYKHHTLLPIGAFNRRGSVVGGRSLRLHGDADFTWGDPEPQEDPNQNFVTTNYESGEGYYVPAPAAAPVYSAPAASAPVYSAPVYSAPVYSAPDPVVSNAVSQTEQPTFDDSYEVEEVFTGGDADSGYNYDYVLKDPFGDVINYLNPVKDDYGNITGYQAPGTREYGENAIFGLDDLASLTQQYSGVAQTPYGTGKGPALGYEYGIRNSGGDIYQKYDAQGNLTEFLDKDGNWQKTSDVKPIGATINYDTGQLETVYEYGGRTDIVGNTYVPGMSPFHEDQGGFFGEGAGPRFAALLAAGLSAGVAGGAFSGLGLGTGAAAGTASSIATTAINSALNSMAITGMSGGSYSDMVQSGLKAAAMAGLSDIASAELISGLEKTVDMGALSGGGFEFANDAGSFLDIGDAGGAFSGLIGDAGGSMSYQDILKRFESGSGNVSSASDSFNALGTITTGLETAIALKQNEGMTREQATEAAITESLKNNPKDLSSLLIDNIYKQKFGEGVDQSGLDYWLKDLEAGASIEDVLKNIDTIAQDRAMSEIQDAYLENFGTEADEAGLSYWLNDLKSGQSIKDILGNIDTIAKQIGKGGTETVVGGEGNDVIDTEIVDTDGGTTDGDTDGNINDIINEIIGGAGNDTLVSGEGNDTLTGGAGNDINDIINEIIFGGGTGGTDGDTDGDTDVDINEIINTIIGGGTTGATGTTVTTPTTSTPDAYTEVEEEEEQEEERRRKQEIEREMALLFPSFAALPGYLQGTFLQGDGVNEYNPFENLNHLYQTNRPVKAAQGGSPLQLAQMQQGIYGGDPSQYSILQKRPTPNYFTYGADASGEKPSSFAGSALLGKPTPRIPVTPTGNPASGDWLYKGAGSNLLSGAGAGLASLSSDLMAEGGQPQREGEGEHIPEFITGATGHYVRGRGDGQSDDIPAMLADGEYVFDSSSVSTLGNGSSDAGAKLLDAFRETLREHTRAAPKDKIPPKASPLQYMQEAMKKVGMR
jgi:ribosomal protein L12E/L44/L45/RPP1/RPP2